MARTQDILIGTLHGVDSQGGSAAVRVYKAGRTYRITHADQRHLCHPSVRSIDKVKAEALLVFHVRDASYEPI